MKWLGTLIIMITCLGTGTWAMAGDSRDKLAQVAGNHEKYADKSIQGQENRNTTAGSLPAPTLLSEIRAVMDSTRLAERALRDEFNQDQDPELTRRLGELKKSSRMRILHIQLRYAQAEGRKGLERRIRTSIEDLQRPMTPGGPRNSGWISPSPELTSAGKPAGGS